MLVSGKVDLNLPAFNKLIKFATNITLTMAFHISILQGSPSCSPEPDMLKKTEMGNTMPRSLTIDEMEHICRHVINFVNIEKNGQ